MGMKEDRDEVSPKMCLLSLKLLQVSCGNLSPTGKLACGGRMRKSTLLILPHFLLKYVFFVLMNE